MPVRIPGRFRLTPSDVQMGVFMARGGQDALIRAVVMLDGRTNVERLRRALRLLLDAEPVAGCSLVEGGRRPHAARVPDLDAVELLTVVDLPADAAVHNALERWSLTPLDPHDGPLLRAALFRPAGGGDTFCLKLQHLLCDGAGTVALLYELAAIYAALERDPDHRPRPNVRGDRGYWQVVRRMSPRELWAALKPRPMPWAMRDEQAWSLPSLPPGEGPGALLMRELPAGQLATIRCVGAGTGRHRQRRPAGGVVSRRLSSGPARAGCAPDRHDASQPAAAPAQPSGWRPRQSVADGAHDAGRRVG